MEAIVVFEPLKAQIKELEAFNQNVSFEYRTPTGEEMARSHIFKLRKVKGQIADLHKTAKADALLVCKELDEQKRNLTAEIETMIKIHQDPLDVIAAELTEKERLEQLAKDQAEAARLKDLENRERAVKQAEQKILDEQRAKEDAELQKMQADANAARDRRLAQEAIERAEAQKKADEDKRKANQAHRDAIQMGIIENLTTLGTSEYLAAIIVTAIDNGKINNLKIQY